MRTKISNLSELTDTLIEKTSLILLQLGGISDHAAIKTSAVVMDETTFYRTMNDPVNVGEIEYRYSIIARKCGINMLTTCSS